MNSEGVKIAGYICAFAYMGNYLDRPLCFSPKVFRVFASEEEDEIVDPVEQMLKKTGCLEKHYSVQECIAETKDWRQCQNQVQEFKDCMAKYKQATLNVKSK